MIPAFDLAHQIAAMIGDIYACHQLSNFCEFSAVECLAECRLS